MGLLGQVKCAGSSGIWGCAWKYQLFWPKDPRVGLGKPQVGLLRAIKASVYQSEDKQEVLFQSKLLTWSRDANSEGGWKVPEEERQIKKEDSSSIRLLGSKWGCEFMVLPAPIEPVLWYNQVRLYLC